MFSFFFFPFYRLLLAVSLLLLFSFIILFVVFLSCCKAHDFCEKEVLTSVDKCKFERGVDEYFIKKFKYNKDTYKCGKYV